MTVETLNGIEITLLHRREGPTMWITEEVEQEDGTICRDLYMRCYAWRNHDPDLPERIGFITLKDTPKSEAKFHALWGYRQLEHGLIPPKDIEKDLLESIHRWKHDLMMWAINEFLPHPEEMPGNERIGYSEWLEFQRNCP